jgi:hypothetical protein
MIRDFPENPKLYSMGPMTLTGSRLLAEALMGRQGPPEGHPPFG